MMGKITSKFRIGEKIFLGFGLVGCLFLVVIWQYHAMLEATVKDYQRLLDIYVARLTHAQTIEQHILSARLSEKDFIATRDMKDAELVKANTDALLTITDRLASLDHDDKRVANHIRRLSEDYQQAFSALINAWHVKGLDYNSGLQGAFRNSVHELEALAAQFETGDLYVLLLQIRRGEKDLGLRRERIYETRVKNLIEDFILATQQSALTPDTRNQLLARIAAYKTAFADYANNVLADGEINGGRGPFRDIAHSIEALIKQNYVPELKADILQLRRREKDYLLREEQQYIDMVSELITLINLKADDSGISRNDKKRFAGLLTDYQRDFTALVDQNQRIGTLMAQMESAVKGITGEVQRNAEQANASKTAMVAKIDQTVAMGERQLFWIVLLAVVTGVIFAFIIIRGISRPLRRMVSILDQLSFEETTERMPYITGGRDEVNVMARSVNTMADHRHQFIQWWQASMAENEAMNHLQTLAEKSGGDLAQVSPGKRQRAEAELTTATLAKQQLLDQQLEEINYLAEETIQNLSPLLDETHLAHTTRTLNQILHAAQTIKSKLAMVLYRSTGDENL